jgi:nicotinic acid mononucleotide adenylyltransferase
MTELFLIIGEDQAKALQTWREWQLIFQSATICVADRARFDARRTSI